MTETGPKGSFLFGCVKEFAQDSLGFLMKTAKDFPRFAEFRFAYWKVNLLTDPEYIKHVLVTNNRNYQKGKKYQELRNFLGDGLLTSEGEFWRRQRRMAQPSFSRQRITSFIETMISYTDETLDRWKQKPAGQPFDLTPEMMRLTMGIVGDTLFGKNLLGESKEIGESIGFLIETTNERIQSAFNSPLWWPSQKNRRIKKEKKRLDDMIYGLIEERKHGSESFNDLLAMLMETFDEETGEKMSDVQLRDEVATSFVAGHETSAVSLTWTLYLLSQHPEIEQKLVEETNRITKGGPLKKEHVPQLTYAMQIIEESMRLYPPAWLIARRALEDDEVDGRPILKNHNVFLSPYIMHHSEQYWEDPEKFDPQRFSPENKKSIDKFTYFPFGGGQRLCIGNNFALMEMQIVLTKIYQEFSLTTVEGFEPELAPLVTLRPKNGMMVQLVAR